MTIAIDRSTVIRGPGAVTLGSVKMFDRDSIKVDNIIDSFDVPVSAYGIVDTRRKDISASIAFRPCGEITANILTTLFPHGTPSIGSSIFGATDTAGNVHSTAGVKLAFNAAAITKMPGLRLSTTETAFASEAQLLALIKNNTARTADAAMYAVTSEAFSGAFDVANVKGGAYQGVWGTGPGITFQTSEGWLVEFDMQTQPQYCDGVGTYDHILTGVTCRAKCRPIGISESTLMGYLTMQGASAGLGATLRSGLDLVISATGGLTVTIKEVSLMTGPMEWGLGTLRIGEIGFVGHRTITAGVPGALFSVALTPA